MLKRALASSPSPKVELIYAAPDREHILYAAEFDALARTAPSLSYETVIAPADKIYDRLFDLGASAMGHGATLIARATSMSAASARASSGCAICSAAPATSAAPFTTSSGDAAPRYLVNALRSAADASATAFFPWSSTPVIVKNPSIIPS